MVICLEWSASDLHVVELMPLPSLSFLDSLKSGMVCLYGGGLPTLSKQRGC